jgi:nucleoside-diphosphate-sugar epimerase
LKVLATGGAGFIGSHLVDALVRGKHRVRVLDNFVAGKRENLRDVRGKVDVLRGDCSDPAVARRAVRGIEVVYHEAAVPSVARSVADPITSHRANATGTLVMLAAARESGVRRFIYAGSSSVYGDVPTLPKRETMDPRPRSPYAIAKLTGEHYVRVFAALYGMETLTLRYFNVFGPRQAPDSPYSGVISRFVTALLDRATPVIHGDGRQTRDFTYVDNVVDANLRGLTARGLVGQAVNVATGTRVSLRALLAALGRDLERPAKARYGPVRAGDIRHSLADIRLARKLLGYRPIVDFETGLRRTVEWYRQNSPRSAR